MPSSKLNMHVTWYIRKILILCSVCDHKEGRRSCQCSKALFICCLLREQWPGSIVKYPAAFSLPLNNWLWNRTALISELWLLAVAPLSTTELRGHLILITILWSKDYNHFHLLPSMPKPRELRPLAKISFKMWMLQRFKKKIDWNKERSLYTWDGIYL